MATVSIRPEFPNILIMAGTDAHSPLLIQTVPQTLNALPATPEHPVRRGTHDFWIMNPKPGLGSGMFFGGDDTAHPRPLRGMVNMGFIPSQLTSPTIATYLATLLQEVGHFWLVPGGLRVEVGNAVLPLATDVQLTQAINDDVAFPAVPLLGRANAHWSAYWRADGSPMDGLCHQEYGDEDGYAVWRAHDLCSTDLFLDNTVPGVSLNPYCDLDLTIMGAVPAAEAYRGSEQGVMWMQPHLTDDVESRAGMVVVFSQHDQIIFGFEKNHMILTVTNNDGAILGGFVIAPNYHSLGHDLNGMQLRVVRQRNKYYFQAKRSNPAGGCLLAVLSALGLYGGTLPGVWDGVENPGPIKFNTDFRDWKTVAIVQRTSAPVAVGMTVNKWRHPHLCDAAFYRLELKQDAKEWSIETDSMPVPMTRGDYASLQDGTAFREDTDGAIFRVTGPQLHIIAPFSRVVNGVLDHLPDHTFHHGRDADGNLIDNSPKVLTRAPTGDFAFATHAKIHRTIVTPWAGGYANLKTMFGKTTAVPATAVQVPPVIKGRQDVPPGNAYRMAFIIVVPDEASATLEALQRLDTLRRFWEVAFSFATKGQRLADTAL